MAFFGGHGLCELTHKLSGGGSYFFKREVKAISNLLGHTGRFKYDKLIGLY